jgi:hypothetical protein
LFTGILLNAENFFLNKEKFCFEVDLVGEAVVLVNDLPLNMSSKRVLQLHRNGQTKTGSLTVEVENRSIYFI